MVNDSSVLREADLPLPLFIRGKVRDTYDLGNHLLIIATDRISAFDSVLPSPIPRKGFVLNQLSVFWFRQTAEIVPNHLIEPIEDIHSLDTYIPEKSRFPYPAYLIGRSMVVKKVKRVPIECVVRGYLAGSGWAEYQECGKVAGFSLPKGLKESQKLPEPLFTPTTKADAGHDLPISMEEIEKLLGKERAREIKEKSIAVYNYAQEYARKHDLIIADTKMEFGLDGDRLILIDELLTPDSSRIWDSGLYQVGQAQPGYDKQPLRDWLVDSGWNKEPPAPPLPADVVEATSRRYIQAYERVTGRELK
ncbi:MAG: phosphoribosylaminoimidazolesuccinocarboxamide synthase [Chloroflexi bacterium]|nr:phosphoribosylaminoimidazolesuccinocarboxamide synthase [Chloroflexota bacterium]